MYIYIYIYFIYFLYLNLWIHNLVGTHSLFSYNAWCTARHSHACVLSCFSHVQLFVTLWTVSTPVSSVHGILQAGILEWVFMPSSMGSF